MKVKGEKRRGLRSTKGYPKVGAELLSFPGTGKGPLLGSNPLIVPEDLRSEIKVLAVDLGYSEEQLLRCMLELEISLASKRA